MASIEFSDVRKSYGTTQVVHGISLTVTDGEFVVLVGPSGCGKSTALRMIAGLETITRGDLSIGDRVVNTLPPKDRDVAMVFQNYALYPHMTVYDNMAFSLKLRKAEKSVVEERVKKAADILNLSPYLQRYPRQLSGGQRQRVAMGRAIVRNPQVFLFDEPLSNLDAKLRVAMRVELKKLHQRLATTSIYVTHDQVEAMTLGDRVVVMRAGIIEQVGEPLDLYDRPATKYVAGFIGSPAMNFADVRIVDAGGKLTAENEGIRITVPPNLAQRLAPHVGRRATLGVRPENLHMAAGSHPAELTFDAGVEVAEQLGSEILLDVKAGTTSIVASVEPTVRVKPGETVKLAIDPDRMHFFDAENERAI